MDYVGGEPAGTLLIFLPIEFILGGSLLKTQVKARNHRSRKKIVESSRKFEKKREKVLSEERKSYCSDVSITKTT